MKTIPWKLAELISVLTSFYRVTVFSMASDPTYSAQGGGILSPPPSPISSHQMILTKTVYFYVTNKQRNFMGTQFWSFWSNFKMASKFLIWPDIWFSRKSGWLYKRCHSLVNFWPIILQMNIYIDDNWSFLGRVVYDQTENW